MINETKLRAVFDTNVIIAALKSKNPNSPVLELISRWYSGEFMLVLSKELLSEYREKMLTKKIAPDKARAFLYELHRRAEFVALPESKLEQIVNDDPDDDIVIGTALAGGATHLVTYDKHLLDLGSPFRGIEIVKGLPFLYAVRGDTPPE